MNRVRSAIALVVVLIAASAGVANAHTATDHYRVHWPYDASVPYTFAPSYPGGAFEARSQDAAAQWNAAGGLGEPSLWNAGRNSGELPYDHCIDDFSSANQFHYLDLDFYSSSTLGLTYTCYYVNSGEIISFQLNIDNDRDWYTGTGDASDGFLGQCIPSCQNDLWSIITHEFGHALGMTSANGALAHFDESDAACPDDNARNTMCPTYRPGTERQRDLATHDIHTFTAAY